MDGICSESQPQSSRCQVYVVVNWCIFIFRQHGHILYDNDSWEIINIFIVTAVLGTYCSYYAKMMTVSRTCGLAYLSPRTRLKRLNSSSSSSRSDRLVLISPYFLSHCQCEMHFQVNWVELGISSVTADQIPLF